MCRCYQMAIDAIELRPGPEARSRVAHLATRRGEAFAAVGQWAQAREAFEAALEAMDPQSREQRCNIVLALAIVAFWQLDLAYMRRLADEGSDLARQTGRRDLEAKGIAWLARDRQAAGELAEAIALDRQALDCEKGVRTVALCHAPLTLYLAGRSTEAVDMGRHVVRAAREAARVRRSLPRQMSSAQLRVRVTQGPRDRHVCRIPPRPLRLRPGRGASTGSAGGLGRGHCQVERVHRAEPRSRSGQV